MISKEKLAKLYKDGLSMKDISDKTGCGYRTIVYWMQRFNISRRSRSEATYFKRNPNGDPFKLKNKLTNDETLLKGLGLGLYWGEGDKSNNNTQARIGNTDPYLIKKFREFLIKICGVKKEKIKYSLIIFNNANKLEAINFWKKYLRISEKQLGKVTIIPPQGKGTYRKKNQFGVLTITVINKKLKEIILRMIRDIYA